MYEANCLPSTSKQSHQHHISPCERTEEAPENVQNCYMPSKPWKRRRKSCENLFVVLILLLVYDWPPIQAVEESQRIGRVLEALMVESLRNNLVQACDNEKITLHCPRNTHILIQNSFYGRLVPSQELCPGPVSHTASTTPLFVSTNASGANSSIAGLLLEPTPQDIQQRRRPPDSFPYEDTSCDFAEAHNKITELCRSKRKCRIVVKASFFGDSDPCASTSKYLQISYKCKPISFEDQNFCQGTTMQLACKPNKRLSIYSAQYGHTVNGQAMHCSSPSQVAEPLPQDCIRDVLPEILKDCHAQTDCSIGINDHFLGNPCSNGVQKYLSLIYMCVNDEVFSEAALKGTMDSMDELKQQLEFKRKYAPSIFTPLQPEEVHHQRRHHLLEQQARNSDEKIASEKSTLEHEVSSDYGIEHGTSGFDSTAAKGTQTKIPLQSGGSNNDEQQQGKHLPNAVGVAGDFLGFVDFIKANKEKSLLYFFLSAASGVILLLLVCIFHQCRARSKEKKQSNLLASRNHQTISVCRLPEARSGAELSSLIGSSNNTSPLYLGSDDSRNCVGLDNGIVGPSTHSVTDYCGVGTGNDSSRHKIYGGSTSVLHQQIYHGSGSSHSSAEKFGGIRTNSRGGTSRSGRNDYQWDNMTNPPGQYTRYSQVTPPRIPPSLHYYS